MKTLITLTLSMILASSTAYAEQAPIKPKLPARTCHEILGTAVTVTNLECHDLDETTPGRYWYEKTPLAPGAKFAPEFTIKMRKMAREQREAKLRAEQAK